MYENTHFIFDKLQRTIKVNLFNYLKSKQKISHNKVYLLINLHCLTTCESCKFLRFFKKDEFIYMKVLKSLRRMTNCVYRTDNSLQTLL